MTQEDFYSDKKVPKTSRIKKVSDIIRILSMIFAMILAVIYVYGSSVMPGAAVFGLFVIIIILLFISTFLE